MFDKLRKKLYFERFEVLFAKYYREGRIKEFDDEIYEKMRGTIISCFPVEFYIKHSKYTFPLGTCYDRSLYMFLALDNAVLVRGDNKDLEYNYGMAHGGHGWVEVGDYVYDPSIMLRFEKKVYYQLYQCHNVYKIDKETYLKEHREFVDSVVSTDYDDYRPGGKRRLDLGIIVIQMREIAAMSDDDNFKKDLKAYLDLIEYNPIQIQEERNRCILEMLSGDDFSKVPAK